MTDNDASGLTDRRSRLSFLRRQRSGEAARARVGEFLRARDATAAARLLPLDQSDPVREALLRAVGSVREQARLSIRGDLPRDRIDNELKEIASRWMYSEEVFVALSQADQIGILAAQWPAFASLSIPLLDFDRDSLIITSHSLEWGLVMQRFENGDRTTYQIEAWEPA